MSESEKIVFTTLLSAIFGGSVAIVVCYINNRQAKESLARTLDANEKKLKADMHSQSSKTYKELVTAERIKWLNLLRESMAEYMSQTYILLNLSVNRDFLSGESKQAANRIFFQKQIEHNYKSINASFLVQLRLNPNQDNHKKLIEYMNELDQKVVKYLKADSENESLSLSFCVREEVEVFAIKCQELLKEEWDHVKKEASSPEEQI